MPQTSPVVPIGTPRLRVGDAVDDFDRPIGALRAVEALTTLHRADSATNGEEDLPNLHRFDLGCLLSLVVQDLEQRHQNAKQAAQASLAYAHTVSQPVATKGAKA